jgi:hypothetical protein
MTEEQITLYASHCQFYIMDNGEEHETAEGFWTDRALADRLALAEGIIGIGTGTYGEVRVRAQLLAEAPRLQREGWDHITEASLNVREGPIFVLGCLSSSGLFFQVRPGWLRVRCYAAGLGLDEDAKTGAREDYLVQMWPAPETGPKVWKRWKG